MTASISLSEHRDVLYKSSTQSRHVSKHSRNRHSTVLHNVSRSLTINWLKHVCKLHIERSCFKSLRAPFEADYVPTNNINKEGRSPVIPPLQLIKKHTDRTKAHQQFPPQFGCAFLLQYVCTTQPSLLSGSLLIYHQGLVRHIAAWVPDKRPASSMDSSESHNC